MVSELLFGDKANGAGTGRIEPPYECHHASNNIDFTA